MPSNQQVLYAVELDISKEAGVPDYWVIHAEADSEPPFELHLCVYEAKKEALKSCRNRDHKARVVKFIRYK